MKRMPSPPVKFLNMMAVFLPFLLVWFMYYEPRTLSVGSKKVSVLVLVAFFLIFYYVNQQMDGFQLSIMQIRDVILSQILAVMVTDALIYMVIWIASVRMPRIVPGVCALAVQCGLIGCTVTLTHMWYFRTHPPVKAAVVFDQREGVEDLISAYGMHKRFRVQASYHVQQVLDELSLLDGMHSVFICGVNSHQRNIILKYCTQEGISVYVIPRIGDAILLGAERMHMFYLPILKAGRYDPSTEYLLTKRMMDIGLSLLGLIVLSPVMALTALAIKADGGPALYRQDRLTKDGKVFQILKFRSMCVDAEKLSGAVLSSGDSDPRITKVGRVIRACRLDELPQLINILMGDMSIVGPRPERPEIARIYEQELPEFRLRLQVKAGLTGYAQVYGKYNTTPYDKLLMDLMYISKPSILEDLSIILATVKILAKKESTQGVTSQPAAHQEEKEEAKEYSCQ